MGKRCRKEQQKRRHLEMEQEEGRVVPGLYWEGTSVTSLDSPFPLVVSRLPRSLPNQNLPAENLKTCLR